MPILLALAPLLMAFRNRRSRVVRPDAPTAPTPLWRVKALATVASAVKPLDHCNTPLLLSGAAPAKRVQPLPVGLVRKLPTQLPKTGDLSVGKGLGQSVEGLSVRCRAEESPEADPTAACGSIGLASVGPTDSALLPSAEDEESGDLSAPHACVPICPVGAARVRGLVDLAPRCIPDALDPLLRPQEAGLERACEDGLPSSATQHKSADTARSCGLIDPVGNGSSLLNLPTDDGLVRTRGSFGPAGEDTADKGVLGEIVHYGEIIPVLSAHGDKGGLPPEIQDDKRDVCGCSWWDCPAQSFAG